MDRVKHYIDSNANLLVKPVKEITDDSGVYLEFITSDNVTAWESLSFTEKSELYKYKLDNDGIYYYYRLQIPKRSELEVYNETTDTITDNKKGKIYWDDKHYTYNKITYTEDEFILDENGEKIIDTETVTFKKDPLTGEYILRWMDVQDLDSLGQPVVSDTGGPVYKNVYTYETSVVRTYKKRTVTKYKIEKTAIADTENLIYSKKIAGDNGEIYYKEYIISDNDSATTITLETLLSNINDTDYGLMDHSYIVDADDIFAALERKILPVPVFCTHYIDSCLEELERQAVKDRCTSVKSSCSSTSNTSRDFLIISHFLMQRLILEHDYTEAQKIIDFITACGAPCSNLSNDSSSSSGCGCS